MKVLIKICERTPISPDLHPEMDKSDRLDEEDHNAYEHVIGILW